MPSGLDRTIGTIERQLRILQEASAADQGMISDLHQHHQLMREVESRVVCYTGPELPERAYDGDAGIDLAYNGDKPLKVKPGDFVDVPTGVRVALPPYVWARIVGRSSTLRKRRLLVGEGVIDTGYRGELYVGVWNLHCDQAVIEPGARIAQLILQQHVERKLVQVEELPGDTDRGEQGFGSTG